MIISHQHKFIFIKTSKTAGSSIEIALSKYCGEDDIMTRDMPDEEALKRDLGYRTAQNYKVPFHRYSLGDYREMLVKTLRGEKRKTRRYYNHSSSADVRDLLGEEIWNSYYKFCFERNPWDRSISYYYFMAGRKNQKGKVISSLPDFIFSGGLYPLKRHGIDNYMINGKRAVERVCLYENLDAELEYVCNHIIGLEGELQLPRVKGSYRKDKRHYREILGNEERDYIADLFSDEIRMFGYEF